MKFTKLILLFLVALLFLFSTRVCESYRGGGRRGRDEDRRSSRHHDEEEDVDHSVFSERDRRKLNEFDDQVRVFIDNQSHSSVGGKLNCALCTPCLDKVKACHSLCHFCNSYCVPNKCDFSAMYKKNHPAILNSTFYDHMRVEPTADPDYIPDDFVV